MANPSPALIQWNSFTLPNVGSLDDPRPGIKNVVIEGTRGDGAIVIPGGTPTYNITIRGVIIGSDYDAVMSQIVTLRSTVTTAEATLTVERDSGSFDTYTVRRIGDIQYSDSPNMRTQSLEYSITFLVLEIL